MGSFKLTQGETGHRPNLDSKLRQPGRANIEQLQIKAASS